MSDKVKYISIKIHTYYFFDDIVNIKKFYPNNIKIDEKPYKNVHIYNIRYVTIKDPKYVKVNVNKRKVKVNVKVNGYFEEINKNNLTLIPTDESKVILKRI